MHSGSFFHFNFAQMDMFDLATIEFVNPDGTVEMFKSSRDEDRYAYE